MHVSMNVGYLRMCIFLCMYVCMYVCIYIHIQATHQTCFGYLPTRLPALPTVFSKKALRNRSEASTMGFAYLCSELHITTL